MAEQDPLHCAECPVRDIAVCAGMGEAERRDLARLGRRRRFARGRTIFAAGDDSIACATLVSGTLKLARVDAQGTERMLGLVYPAGFLARLFAPTLDSSAIALTDVELCLFARSDVEREMHAHSGFMARVLAATTDQLAQSHALIELIGRNDARARLAGLLCLLVDQHCDGPADNGLRLELPLGRGDIAALLGTTIETISRQIGALEAEGIVRRDGLRHLLICDVGMLHRAAGLG